LIRMASVLIRRLAAWGTDIPDFGALRWRCYDARSIIQSFNHS